MPLNSNSSHDSLGAKKASSDVPEQAGPFDANDASRPILDGSDFGIFFVNIQGLLSHLPELTAALHVLKIAPGLVCLNETFLDASIESITLEGYELVARRDRDDGRKCGGVAVFANVSVKSRVTLLSKSDDSERVWVILHADTGPLLIGVWYRPPEPGEIATI
jgi:hypothetical protein